MAWVILERINDNSDNPIGFCGNPYVDTPTSNYIRNAYATNPSRAEFVNAMVIDQYAYNWHDITVGQSYTATLKGGYWWKVERQTSNYYQFTTNLPDIGSAGISAVFNFLYFAAFIDPATEKACFGYYGWYSPIDYSPGYFTFTATASHDLYVALNAMLPPPPPTDPYSGGGTSTGTDTPTGEFDDSSESVPLPTTWTSFGAGYSKMVAQYVLTQSDMMDLAAWLWYGNTALTNLQRWFNNPFEAIISVGMLPFTPSDTTDYNVYLGGVDAETKGKKVNDQIEKISLGSVTLNGYYGAAWDYNPFTKIELYLPYCGVVGLNPDEVMNHTISIDYYCDSFSGDCVAFVSDEDRVLQTVKGNCFVPIPIMGRDFTSVYSSALGAVATIAGLTAAAATGGITAPMAAGLSTSIAGNVLAAKTHVTRASSVGGMSGFMSIQNPYMIITFPRQCLPELQNDHQGYPLFVTKALNEFTGYTKVHEIHLDNLDATDAEQKEIYELLKGGVIL